MNDAEKSRGGINTYNEKPLHAAIKQWYAGPGDQLEVAVDGYKIDVVHGDMLVEIQTRQFNAIRRKLFDLSANHRVRLVYPVAVEKWIVILGEGDESDIRRKSPRRGKIEDLFKELVYLPGLMRVDNFSLEVLLIVEEEIRRRVGNPGFRKKGWIKQESRLVRILGQRIFHSPTDLGALLPEHLAQPFTTRELAKAARLPLRLSYKMVYCLREMDVLQACGKRGRSVLYRCTPADSSMAS